MRLYCLPPAGGSAALFRGWAERLPPEIEIRAIQLPGRENRFKEAPLSRLSDLIPALDALLESDPRPFALYGHSMGARIGYELAVSRRDRGLRLPAKLFFSGRIAPHATSRFPLMWNLPHDEFVAQLEGYGGTPRAVLEDRELMELFVPVLRADFTLLETIQFRETAPLHMPIAMFGGADDPRATPEEIREWSRYAAGAFSVHICPGGHFFIRDNEEPFMEAFRRELASVL